MNTLDIGGQPRIWGTCEPNDSQEKGTNQLKFGVGPKKIRTEWIIGFSHWMCPGPMSQNSFRVWWGGKLSGSDEEPVSGRKKHRLPHRPRAGSLTRSSVDVLRAATLTCTGLASLCCAHHTQVSQPRPGLPVSPNRVVLPSESALCPSLSTVHVIQKDTDRHWC